MMARRMHSASRTRGCLGFCAAIIVTCALSVIVLGGNTYITDIVPNVTVSEPDCHAFTITVTQASGTSATLSLRVEDVDEEEGELDEVRLNGHYLGTLTGTDGTWSTTTFDISDQVYYSNQNGGVNTIEICIDPGGGESTTWVATIDWGQILVDGGGAEDAAITSVDASGEWNAIQVEADISAANSDTYRLEINLLDGTGNNKDIAIDTFSMTGGTSTTRFNTVSLPSEPASGETFTIEALLFNHTTGVQQNVMTTTWSHASEPPTDISLSANDVDENLPPASLVGELSASDVDSTTHTFSLVGGDIASFSIVGDDLRTAVTFDHESRDTYDVWIEAEDEDENTVREWFSITVNDVNEAPVAENDAASVPEGASVSIAVLANDSDPDDGDTLRVIGTSDPLRGTAVIEPDDTIRYVPDPGACGVDTFDYTVEDVQGATTSATITVTIVNQAPVATGDLTQTPEGTAVEIDVLSNDTDAGGGALAIAEVGTPTHGTAEIVGDRIRYTPQIRFEGSDRFSYTVRDTCGATATAFVDAEVTHLNHPPIANAGGPVQGVVGDRVRLDASFSTDPDIEDVLQYRWDVDGDRTFDTNWLSDPTTLVTYDRTFVGQITVEVRDLYRGQPTGTSAQATTFARIDPRPPELRCIVFVDLDADGLPGEDEPRLPKIELALDETSLALTDERGVATFARLEAGEHAVAVTENGLALLLLQGLALTLESPSVVRDVQQGDPTVAWFPARSVVGSLTGLVYIDTDGSGEREQGEPPVPGLTVSLGEGLERTTDDSGRFLFMNVTAGEYTLTIASEQHRWDGSIVIDAGEKTERTVIWPSPDSGFLDVKIELDRPGEEERD